MSTTVYRPSLDVVQTGGSITIVDEDNTVRQIIGTQPDGTVGVVAQNGPPPPEVSTPVVTDATLGLTVTWDGLLAGETVGATLNANTDFETGIAPWDTVLLAGQVEQSTDQHHGGTHSARLTPDGVAATIAMSSELVGVTAGASYQADGWVWATSASTAEFSLTVDWYDANSQYLSSSANLVDLPATEWAQVLNTVTAPAGAVFAKLTPTLAGTPAATAVFYLDDVAFASVTLDTPADFDHVAVHVSEATGFTPDASTLAGTLTHAGSFPVTPLDGGTEYFVRLVGVNTSGIAGDPSAQASGTPSEVVATSLLDGIVTTVKLADDAVTQAKIAAAAVGTAQLGDESVDLSKLADGSVDASKLVEGAVTADALGAGAVGTAALADGSVTASQMAAAAIEAAAIADGAVGTDALAAGSVTADIIAAGAVGADEIAANSITAGQIAAGAIGVDELAANSVVAGKIAADAVDTDQLVAGSVETEQIAAGAVAADQIAANAVTTAKLAASAVTAGQLAANAVTAGKINAGAVTADKLEANLVLATAIVAGIAAGARVQLDDTGINAYDAGGNNTVMIGADGNAIFRGSSVSASEIDTTNMVLNAGDNGALLMYGTVGAALNANPDMLTGITGWTSSGTGVAISYSSTHQYNGHNTLRMVASSGAAKLASSTQVTVTAGQPYSADVLTLLSDATTLVTPYITWLNSSLAAIGVSAGTPIGGSRPGNWIAQTVAGVAPVGATSALVDLGFSSSSAGAAYVAHFALAGPGLAASLATAAGTDQYGNNYPAGFFVAAGAAIGPVCRLVTTSNKTLVTAGFYTVPWDSAEFDTVPLGASWNPAAPTRFACTKAGIYRLTGTANMLTTGARILIRFAKNSAVLPGRSGGWSGTSRTAGHYSRLVQLAVGDFIEMQVFTDATTPSMPSNTDDQPCLEVEYLHS